MKVRVNGLLGMVVFVAWVCGIAVAGNVWLMIGSFFFPPLSFVLLARHFLL